MNANDRNIFDKAVSAKIRDFYIKAADIYLTFEYLSHIHSVMTAFSSGDMVSPVRSAGISPYDWRKVPNLLGAFESIESIITH